MKERSAAQLQFALSYRKVRRLYFRCAGCVFNVRLLFILAYRISAGVGSRIIRFGGSSGGSCGVIAVTNILLGS